MKRLELGGSNEKLFQKIMVAMLMVIVALSTVPCHVVDYLALFGAAEPWPGPQAHSFDFLELGQSHHQAMT